MVRLRVILAIAIIGFERAANQSVMTIPRIVISLYLFV